MVVMSAYFDASMNGEFMGVAGYLFRKKSVRPFEARWRGILRKYELPYFHMTDCNGEQGPFRHLTRDQCDAAAREAMAAIADFAQQGFSASIRPADFEGHDVFAAAIRNPFALCVQAVVGQCRRWAEENDPEARITYMFEAGDAHQADADTILRGIADHADRRAKHRYEGHAFVTKAESLPTQAADILAWHATKQWRREADGVERLRGDFSHLVAQVETRKDFYSVDRMNELFETTFTKAPIDNAAQILGLALRRNSVNEDVIDREALILLRGGGAAPEGPAPKRV